MLCLNSLTRGRCPLGPPLLPEWPISTIKNGWSKFCSIEPNFLISLSSMASRAQRTSKARARFGPIFFRSSVEMYRSENLLAEPTFSFFQRNLRLTLIDRPPPTFHVSEKKCLETLPTMFRTGFGTAGREPVTLWTFQNLGLTAKPKPRISMPFRGTITLFCLLLSSFGCIKKMLTSVCKHQNVCAQCQLHANGHHHLTYVFCTRICPSITLITENTIRWINSTYCIFDFM